VIHAKNSKTFQKHSEVTERRGMRFGSSPHVEAGSNTSTVGQRVVGGDEKGSLESETVKYCHESHGAGTRE
jgi:hypothetical protein